VTIVNNTFISGTITVTSFSPVLTSSGVLAMDGLDLVITPPVFNGFPLPNAPILTSLTRDGNDVIGSVVSGNRVPNALIGIYVAEWSASNGIAPNGFATTSLEVGSPAGLFQLSIDGDHIIMPLPAGFSSGNTTTIDRSKVTITQTVPSKNSLGLDIIRTVPVSVGYSPSISGDNLILPINGWISSKASAISVGMSAGALTNGAATSPLIFTTPVLPGNEYGDGNVKLRIAGQVTGRNGLHMAFSVMDNPFRVEAMGGHDSGLAGVLFSVSNGGVTVEHFVSRMERSTYQDRSIISDAQWNKNVADSGDGIRGGVGVWASPLFDPNVFPDGLATVTVTGYAYVGGSLVSTTDSWQTCLNGGGTYVERIRYVDTVAGSDTNDGLTPATAYATINRAAFITGSLSGGANQWSVPIIKLIGSGNSVSPRTIVLSGSSASGNSQVKVTDTWVTIQPAEGHSAADIWLSSNNVDPRIRRLRFKDVSFDVASGAGGTGNASLLSTNNSVYPLITNPPSVWFDGVDTFHRLGVAGNTVTGNGYVLSTNWSGGRVAYFTRYKVRDMARNAHSCPAISYMRDVVITRTVNDVIKSPRGLIMTVLADNNTLPVGVLRLSSITGTPQVGDIVTGVRSTGVGTVAQIYSPTSILISPQTGSFKLDDNLGHGAVTVANASGFVIGELVNGQRLHRRDGNILRFGQSNGQAVYLPAPGVTLVGATSGATQTVISSASENNIFFSGGARGRLAAPHPDLIQIQAFLPHRVLYTVIAGTFVIGEPVRLNGLAKGNIQEIGVTIDGRPYMTVGGGSYSWFSDTEGQTITGTTSGATATFNGVYDFPKSNPANLVMANIYATNAEGAPFFAENGWNGLFLANLLHLSESGSAGNPLQWDRVMDMTLLHVQAHQQPYANRISAVLRPRSRITTHGILGETVGTNIRSGIGVIGAHAADPAALLDAGELTRGNPGFTNGVGFDESYDPARNDYTPTGGSPLRRFPALIDGAWMPFDLFGNRRPTNGTAAIGAVEAQGL
jgi:hypothetical protein